MRGDSPLAKKGDDRLPEQDRLGAEGPPSKRRRVELAEDTSSHVDDASEASKAKPEQEGPSTAVLYTEIAQFTQKLDALKIR